MAAPQDAPEQGFRLRKFQGTQTEWDSTFIGPSFLVASENWIPTQSYRLGKRPGSTLVQSLPLAVTNLLAAHDPNGVLYLYAFVTTASAATIYEMIEEGAPTTAPAAPNATFPTGGNTRGRLIQFRNRIYAGNGKDPLVSWVLGAPPANTLSFGPIVSYGPAPQATAIAATGLGIVPSGTYTYAWAVFDTVKGIYYNRTDVTDANGNSLPTAQVTVGQNQALSFPVPTFPVTASGAPPAASQVLRLFVSPRNFPVEYATMQADHVTTGPVVLSTITSSATVVPMSAGANVFRTGSMLLIWENRVVFAGSTRTDLDPQAPFCVYATDVILPGFEQNAFNQGTLFPDFAKVVLPAKVTGLGVAGITSEYNPTAPLLFFTQSKTFIVAGDPFDPAGEAEMMEVSSRVGCIAHDSIVATPVGTIWCGLDSIYLMPPGGGFPQDIGWPIANMIRQIPDNLRPAIVATFNKQFYKIAIPGTGDATNTTQWWLDLRQGMGATPAWWGPMTGFSVTALHGDPASHFEVDRCYAAIAGQSAASVMRLHQLNAYTDQLPDLPPTMPLMPIKSRIQSGRFDADQPFLVKVFTRLRLISQTAGATQLHVILTTDGGVNWNIDPILLGQDMELPGQFVHLTPTSPPPPPNNKRWATGPNQPYAKFATVSPAEVQTIMPYDRPRGLNVQVQIIHDPTQDAEAAAAGDPNAPPPFFGFIELRDFELLFLLSERKVRFLNERISK